MMTTHKMILASALLALTASSAVFGQSARNQSPPTAIEMMQKAQAAVEKGEYQKAQELMAKAQAMLTDKADVAAQRKAHDRARREAAEADRRAAEEAMQQADLHRALLEYQLRLDEMKHREAAMKAELEAAGRQDTARAHNQTGEWMVAVNAEAPQHGDGMEELLRGIHQELRGIREELGGIRRSLGEVHSSESRARGGRQGMWATPDVRGGHPQQGVFFLPGGQMGSDSAGNIRFLTPEGAVQGRRGSFRLATPPGPAQGADVETIRFNTGGGGLRVIAPQAGTPAGDAFIFEDVTGTLEVEGEVIQFRRNDLQEVELQLLQNELRNLEEEVRVQLEVTPEIDPENVRRVRVITNQGEPVEGVELRTVVQPAPAEKVPGVRVRQLPSGSAIGGTVIRTAPLPPVPPTPPSVEEDPDAEPESPFFRRPAAVKQADAKPVITSAGMFGG